MNSTTEPKERIRLLPDGVTLADLKLDNIKVGDEVVAIQREDGGTRLEILPYIYEIDIIEPTRVLFCRAGDPERKIAGAWQIKNQGD